MSRRRTADPGRRGFSLIELLVGSAIGVAVLALLAAGTAVGARLLADVTGRGELEDVADLAIEAFRFDVRRAGFSVPGLITDPIPLARADRITVRADLDGDGVVDTNSEETVSIACQVASARVARIVGAQTLPLTSDVTACTLHYFDETGTELSVPAAGLATATRTRVRAVALEFDARQVPGARRTHRSVLVARRGLP